MKFRFDRELWMSSLPNDDDRARWEDRRQLSGANGGKVNIVTCIGRSQRKQILYDERWKNWMQLFQVDTEWKWLNYPFALRDRWQWQEWKMDIPT
jgi:hypothetical protein